MSEEKKYYYHDLRENVRQFLRQEGALNGSIALMALFHSAMIDIAEEEKKNKSEEKS